MRQPRMTAGLGIARSQDFIPGAKTDFYIVGTSPMVIIHETPGAMRTTCRSGSSLVGCIQFESA
jgi:hypothetical protein